MGIFGGQYGVKDSNKGLFTAKEHEIKLNTVILFHAGCSSVAAGLDIQVNLDACTKS